MCVCVSCPRTRVSGPSSASFASDGHVQQFAISVANFCRGSNEAASGVGSQSWLLWCTCGSVMAHGYRRCCRLVRLHLTKCLLEGSAVDSACQGAELAGSMLLACMHGCSNLIMSWTPARPDNQQVDCSRCASITTLQNCGRETQAMMNILNKNE